MKIQLKRSNVLESGAAKAPTAPQMEFGELAVNYNTADPVLFIKDSAGAIIRLTGAVSWDEVEGKPDPLVNWDDIGNKPTVFAANNGEINIEAGAGLTASGDNATADQVGNTTRTLTAYADPGYAIDVTATGLRLGNNWINIPTIS